LETAPVSNR